MIKDLINIYKEYKPIKASKGSFKHVNHSFIETLVSLKYHIKNKNIFVVLPNLYLAQKYYDKLSNILADEDVLFYPADQVLTTIMALGSPEFKNERLFTIRKLINEDKHFVIVTTQDGILKKQLKPVDYQNSVTTLYKGKSYPFNNLARKLVYDGYQYNYTVERPGEFSVRGSIVDIFTHDNKNPYRIDFFGDDIEIIKTFDVITQKSINEVDSVDLSPLHELFYTDKQRDRAVNDIEDFFIKLTLSEKEEEKLENDIENIKNRKKLDSLTSYVSFFNDKETTILDFSKNHEIVIVDSNSMELNEKNMLTDLETFSSAMEGDAFSKLSFRMPLSYLTNKDNLSFELFHSTNPTADTLSIFDVESYQNNLEPLLIFFEQYRDHTIIIALNNESNYSRLKDFLINHKIKYSDRKIVLNKISLLNYQLPGSFLDLNNKIIVVTDETLFSVKERGRVRYRSVINQAIKVRDSSELVQGDYVVHYNFGIGQYIGLTTMDLSGSKRDYLHIIYANNEALYVPTDQIDLVLKYRRFDDIAPKLSRLGSKQWGRTKAAVKQKLKDLSDRLIKLYASRKEAKGFHFVNKGEMLEDFENDFKYEETKDQQTAIDAVKSDMFSEMPMDRLIAGDVGFGKTEVALRAAFIALLNTKQTAYLAPTTVLARQHYYTFKERFEKYGGTVALLSRFVSKREQTEILDKVAKGYIDVVIGTHRLLSDDIKFKDLGLFIIDEEQRFGVLHKEKIKEMKVNVDTLTLSATPIPRTLQMAMYGLKDLSMIETPPLNRYPVQTYVVERQTALVKEAIERELARGGQVFYLFNKVIGIEHMVIKLEELVPQARVAFAHGKMKKQDLERVLSSFIDKEFDVLVSTTIIETGVDIPNTNTLIIHDADRLGLAQLYQLRGRVGRSDRIAYAYLMYDRHKNINDEARKRLSVIEDFTDLGSGFKIALRDLSIRGAGDMLGDEQSGFIDSVGIELYMKILDEVMNSEEEVVEKNDTPEQVFASRHIPNEYIDNDAVRIEIHKRIIKLNSLKDVNDLKDELVDRFGILDLDVLTYMYEKLYKKLGFKIGIRNTIKELNTVKMVIPITDNNYINGIKLLTIAKELKIEVEIKDFRGESEIWMNIRNRDEHWLYLACELLDSYIYK